MIGSFRLPISLTSGDTTLPTITSATVENVNPNKLVVVFSEVVTITNTTGLTITGAATPTLSAPTGSGSTTITFTLSTALTNGQSVTLNVSSSNTIKDAANNSLAATTKAITNNVAASASSYEAETTSYMNAIAIPNDSTVYYATTLQETTGSAIWTSVDTFIKGLKSNVILTKMKAIYPFIGGTAVAHKWNLVNPQDTDAAYRLTFFGSLLHNEFGMEGNGTNSYANTNAFHNAVFTLNSESFGTYQGNALTGDYNTIGCFDGTYGSHLIPDFSNNISVTRSQSTTSGGDTLYFAVRSSEAMHLINRNSSAEYRVRKRDQVSTIVKQATGTINLPMYIGARRDSAGGANYYSPHKIGFSFLANGLSIAEEDAFVILVNQLQTDLKRNV